MGVLHIFNPETDFALAVGKKTYTPPAKVLKLRKARCLFPATFALPGDAILILDSLPREMLEKSEFFDTVSKKGLTIVDTDGLEELFTTGFPVIDRIQPWGWNHHLRKTLIDHGVPEWLVKSEGEIDSLRRLAHRKTTLTFRDSLREMLPSLSFNEVKELTTVEEAISFSRQFPVAFFKAPWSSSGRGVVCSTELTGELLTQWIWGSIRRQGSVMAEEGWLRKADFASEWMVGKGQAKFLGLSLFNTSSDGRYHGNVTKPQEELAEIISSLSPEWDIRIIDAQKRAIESLIAPQYEGPLGIDMLVSDDGRINPCVEINMRLTMGMAAIWSQQQKNRQVPIGK